MSARRVLVVGAMGKMGERVRAAVASEPALRIGALLEAPLSPTIGKTVDGFLVTADPQVALATSDVVIDFSLPSVSMQLLELAAKAKSASVIGTTGFSAEQQARIKSLSKKIPIVLAPNFSVAVNVLAHLVRQASTLLGSAYDAEILEIHHSAKRDAPSGTALKLGEAVASGRKKVLRKHAVFVREGEIGARPPDAIGIQTLRGGDVAGEHTVYFFGTGERLELTHRASTRDHFARGAARAAVWLAEQAPGLYSMEDVLDLKESL